MFPIPNGREEKGGTVWQCISLALFPSVLRIIRSCSKVKATLSTCDTCYQGFRTPVFFLSNPMHPLPLPFGPWCEISFFSHPRNHNEGIREEGRAGQEMEERQGAYQSAVGKTSSAYQLERILLLLHILGTCQRLSPCQQWIKWKPLVQRTPQTSPLLQLDADAVMQQITKPAIQYCQFLDINIWFM